VAQGEGPEVKPQYHKKKKKENLKVTQVNFLIILQVYEDLNYKLKSRNFLKIRPNKNLKYV
jgi:hypothetical protein